MQILFYDVESKQPYTGETRLQRGLGGTEATLTRVAHALADHHEVIIAQDCREPSAEIEYQHVKYLARTTADKLLPDVVVLLKKRQWLTHVADQFPKARRFFWLHNLVSKDLFFQRKLLQQFEIIAVSDFHRTHIEKRLRGNFYQQLLNPREIFQPLPRIHRVYNPIDEDLSIDQTNWQPNEMILASAPRKGLQLNLAAFAKILAEFPEYHLSIATYAAWDNAIQLPRNTTFLQSLSHPALMQRIRQSFCMFYPQYQDPETFGLVYAEANAVGTPVIAHDFGAAREVLSDPCQLIDGKNIQSIIEKIHAWRKARPIVQAKADFRLSVIKQAWINLLNHS